MTEDSNDNFPVEDDSQGENAIMHTALTQFWKKIMDDMRKITGVRQKIQSLILFFHSRALYNFIFFIGRLQTAVVTFGEDKKDYETRRRGQNDIGRSAVTLRQGCGNIHSRAHAQGVDSHGREQTADASSNDSDV